MKARLMLVLLVVLTACSGSPEPIREVDRTDTGSNDPGNDGFTDDDFETVFDMAWPTMSSTEKRSMCSMIDVDPETALDQFAEGYQHPFNRDQAEELFSEACDDEGLGDDTGSSSQFELSFWNVWDDLPRSDQELICTYVDVSPDAALDQMRGGLDMEFSRSQALSMFEEACR